MTNNGTISDKTALSVLLYNEAMRRRKSVSDFAEEIGVGAISLRQFINNKTQRPRTKTLDQIAEALNMTVDEVRRRMDLLPEAMPPIGEWLRQHMAGRYTRASLAKETKISDGALKNYLNGQTLPDSEQAQRLADALGVSSLELARVVVANQIAKEGGAVAPPEPAGEAGGEGQPAAGEAADDASAPTTAAGRGQDEDHLLNLWRKLHPQGRRATIHYIAGLLAEG